MALDASMGPRFCKRGNSGAVQFVQMLKQLQWGHAFVSVETVVDEGAGDGCADASMGPRFCKRGNIFPGGGRIRDVLLLQWGHAFVSVETDGPAIWQSETDRFSGATLL